MFEDVPIDRLATVVDAHDFTLPEQPSLDEAMGSVEVDAIAAYERVIRHAQARQARMVQQLAGRRRRVVAAQHAQSGELIDDGAVIRSLIAEVAMAREVSVAGAQTQFLFATVLARMPRTAGLLDRGAISERVAKAVTSECAELSPGDAAAVDAELAAELGELTVKRAAAAARRQVLAVDPHAAHVRTAKERTDRYVAMRPGPHGTGFLDAKLPAEQAQECWNALDGAARAARSDGDDRTLSQLMADTLVERVTGRSAQTGPDVEVNLVMRPETLFGDEDSPALLAGYGPVPAELARQLATTSRTWVRRLFTSRTKSGGVTDEGENTITDRDPRRRRFDGPLGRLIRAADQHCQRPWCDCRIVDIDHRVPYAEGGATTRDNGDAYCRSSHTIRHLPGWRVASTELDGDIPKVLEWTTPTGHRYRSVRPRPLGHGPPATVPRVAAGASVAERRLRKHLARHIRAG